MISLALSSLLLASLAKTQGQTIEPRLLRQPDIYGDKIAFVYAGDIWLATTQGGAIAQRLTSHPGAETRPRFSPDGKWIAFTGSYDGSPNVYVIPVEGGEPKRLTYSAEGDSCVGWTPDGKVMYTTINGNFTNRQGALYIVDPKGGLPKATVLNEFSVGSFFADGKRIAYNRTNSFNFNWRRYRGGTQGRISIYDFSTNTYSELPSKREQSYHPMTVGNDIYYISDRANGVLNLYKNVGGRDTQLTTFNDQDIRWPTTDGKNIVFEQDGYLHEFNIASGKTVKLSPKILSENLGSRPTLKSLASSITDVTISPSGARVVVSARGELFSLPAKSGETRNMTQTSGVREKSPAWAPDGKTIAYLSDASGEFEIYTQPQAGGTATQLTNNLGFPIAGFSWSPDGKNLLITSIRGPIYLFEVGTKTLKKIDDLPYGMGGLDFSPDGKWIAISKGQPNRFTAVSLYEVATGKLTPINDGHYLDGEVAFDQDSKWLYFTSNRTYSPAFGAFEFSLKVENTSRLYAIPLAADTENPFLDKNDEEPEPKGDQKPDPKAPAPKDAKAEEGMKIDWAGIDQRAIVLPMEAGNYGGLVGAKGGLFYQSNGTLFKYDLGSKDATPIYQGLVGSVDFNPTRTKMAVYNMASRGLQVLDVRPGQSAGSPRVDTSNVEAVIDPKQEWKQIFWDAWRYQRDNFYDPKMNGVDWNAIGKRYEGYLKDVNHRVDLNYILGLMIGELGTGHAYIQAPGDMGVATPRISVGQLGADYESAGGGIKFKKILRGYNYAEAEQAPLGAPGIDVKEGEYLVAIDGRPVDQNTNPASLLVGKVGKLVTLSVNSKPGLDGARKVRVRPIASEGRLRYSAFIEANRKKVAELSGGRIGYMHISDTGAQGSVDFVTGFYSQTDKEAMIVDERWNGGGYIQPWFVANLARKKNAMITPRNGADEPEAPVIEGPKVLLVNQYAGSGGDFFPYMFRKNGVGPLIGKRTWGGLVGINSGYQLIDGGSQTSPSFAIYDPVTNEIIAENTGIDPDIEVDLRPDLVAKGEDPQLAKAVEVLLEKLKSMPAKKPRTETPKVGKPGRINP